MINHEFVIQNKDRFERTISLLSNRRRQLIVDFFLNKKKYKDIAKEWNVSKERIIGLKKSVLDQLKRSSKLKILNLDTTDQIIFFLENYWNLIPGIWKDHEGNYHYTENDKYETDRDYLIEIMKLNENENNKNN